MVLVKKNNFGYYVAVDVKTEFSGFESDKIRLKTVTYSKHSCVCYSTIAAALAAIGEKHGFFVDFFPKKESTFITTTRVKP